MSLRSLIGEIDRSLAIVGIIVSVIVIILFGSGQFALEVTFSSSGQIYVVAGVLLLLACTFYLFTRKSLSSSFPNNLKAIYPHNKLRLCLNIVFLALFSFSVLSLLFRPDPYIRPLYYFVALALMVTVVSLEIVFLPFQRRHVALALLKIMLIGLSIEFSELLIFPDLIGIDPYGHRSLTLGLLSSGHVPAGNTYSNMPLMHILIGLTMSVTNLSYKYATMLSISLPQVFINSIITYLLGRRLLNNERIGLLGGLLLAVAKRSCRRWPPSCRENP